MGDIFDNLRDGDKIIAVVSDNIDESNLIDFITSPGNYDPHIWFDVSLWKEAAKEVADTLKKLDEEHVVEYDINLEKYLV